MDNVNVRTKWDVFVNSMPVLTVVGSVMYIIAFLINNHYSGVTIGKYALTEELFATLFVCGVFIILYFSELLLRKHRNAQTLPSYGNFRARLSLQLVGLIMFTFVLFQLTSQRPDQANVWLVLTTIFAVFVSVIISSIYAIVRLFVFKKFQLGKSATEN